MQTRVDVLNLSTGTRDRDGANLRDGKRRENQQDLVTDWLSGREEGSISQGHWDFCLGEG